MDVWRICRSKYERSAFSGVGADKTEGRWHFKGHRIVYTSENLSLAALELFVHVAPGLMPIDLISIRCVLPESIAIEEVKISFLPSNWRDYPSPDALKKIGTDWLRGMKSLALIVPSAVNPHERNVLLNPSHPEAGKIKVEAGQPFRFDPRMFGKSGN